MYSRLTFLIVLFALAKFSYSQGTWSYMSTIPSGANITSITVVDQNTIFVAAKGNGLYRSLDGGSSWELKNIGLGASGDLYGISAIDSLNCWVGWLGTSGAPASVYRTTDGGTSWTLQWTLSGTFPDGIKMFSPDYGIVIGDPTGNGQPYQFRYTTNGGTTWNLSPTSPIASNEFGVINAFDFLDTNTIWIGSANTVATGTTARIYRTTNGINGNWLNTNVSGTPTTQGLFYQAIAFIDKNNGLAGSNGGDIIKTTNGGLAWSSIAPPDSLPAFSVINMYGFKDGSNVFRMSVGDANGIYYCFKTSDLGTHWTNEPLPIEGGTTSGIQHMQFVNGSLGYSGGLNGVFMKFTAPASGIIPDKIIPLNFNLSQNFPNPFNPSTTIKYQVPHNSLVNLKVFNSLGQEVATLVNGMISTGNYEVQFNASKLSSGVYFYVLKAGNDFNQSRKMLLIK